MLKNKMRVLIDENMKIRPVIKRHYFPAAPAAKSAIPTMWLSSIRSANSRPDRSSLIIDVNAGKLILTDFYHFPEARPKIFSRAATVPDGHGHQPERKPALSRAALGRCLRRHGVSSRLELAARETDKPVTKKSFKDYEPGSLHMDIKHLPQMPDETERRYLFVAIDRATRWVFMEIYADQSDSSSTDFLIKLNNACPIAIVKLLTDNGSQFTDRFSSKKKDPETGDRIPSGKHAFDVLCRQPVIEHRLIPPRHPQTNGMVERFNGRISEVVNQTRFTSRAELELTLRNYLKIYNHNIPQRALNNETPIQEMKKWQAKKVGIIR